MIKSYPIKEVMRVSLAGHWPDRGEYELEGTVVLHLRKMWDGEEEQWVCKLEEWYDQDSFVVNFKTGDEEFYLSEELPDDVAGEIEWLIERCIN